MATSREPEELTLQEVADELGVHYMTAYRYVRIGVLPARKDGRSWKVRRADLDAMGAEAPAERFRGNTPWDERLARRLLAGDEAGAWKVLEAALAAGTSPQEALVEIIAPAMASVGMLWDGGDGGVAEEHTATAICTRLVGRLGSRFTRRGLSKGTIVIGASAHELHGLPIAIAAEYLRQAGYDVVDLGPMLPPAAFGRAVGRAEQLVAVGVSATIAGQDRDLRATVAQIRAAADAPIFLGGPGITSRDQALVLGADDWARTPAELLELVAG